MRDTQSPFVFSSSLLTQAIAAEILILNNHLPHVALQLLFPSRITQKICLRRIRFFQPPECLPSHKQLLEATWCRKFAFALVAWAMRAEMS